MTEYIEREAAKDELLSWTVCINHPEHLLREDAIHVLNAIPAADVAPVRPGRWIMRGGKRYCSECGNRACVTRDSDDFWYTVGTDFCPACGADMRGGDNER